MFRDGLYRIDYGLPAVLPLRSALLIVRNGRLFAADQSGSVYIGTTRPAAGSEGWRLALDLRHGAGIAEYAPIDLSGMTDESRPAHASRETGTGRCGGDGIEFEIEFCYLGPPPD